MRHAVQVGLVAVAAALVLAGCTGSDEPAADSSPTAGDSAVEELPSGEIQQVPELEEGWEGILADVTVDSCPTEAGEVTAEGTVVNTADETRDISIAISWNAPDSTDSLLQLSVTEEDLAAGESVSWQVSSDLPSDAGQCVVLARSGTLVDD